MENKDRLLITLIAVAGFLGVVLVWGGVKIIEVFRSIEPEANLSVELFPQPTVTVYPSAATVIEEVRDLSRLETVSYHVEKVVTAESGQGPLAFLLGDKLLLIALGEVIAGVDLSGLSESDVVVTEDGTIYVALPPAEVLVATLDNDRTQVYDRRTGLIGLNPDLETEARQQAEDLILQAALEDGILEQAGENAQDFMRSWLQIMGFEEVVFPETMPTPTPTLESAGL
ncbi:MAG: DUF4230 domain-containing protein [Anaerolineae bacterium]|nr:DUF4230 domain-containing protein [Anaerolineae bacterium]